MKQLLRMLALTAIAVGVVALAKPAFANAVVAGRNAATVVDATTATLTAVADTYVDSSLPTTNYGTVTQIRVDGSPAVNSYLRFNVVGITGTVSKATLKLYANSNLNGGLTAHRVTDNTWAESTLTFGNAPAMGAVISTSGAISATTWVSFDVTSIVTGNGTYSFGLTSSNVTALSLASRESANSPQLVLATGTTTPVPTAAPTKTATPVSTVAPTTTSDPVMVGAGDIAVCGYPGASETAKLLDVLPGTVFTLGDNSNDEGTAAQYANCFDPFWGRQKARIKPAVGNHDYLTSNGANYFAYFGAASVPTKAYYSYNLGTWHIVVLNSECSHVGGCQSGSAQEQWLKADLAANKQRCTLAYWHEPRFSSGQWGNHTRYDAFWQDLYADHATLVMNGHDHDYERFAPQNPNGGADPNGIREFVIGTGGAGLGPWTTIQPNSQVRYNGAHGVMKLTLHAASYDWKFIPVAGKTFTDSGSEACN